MDKELTLFVIFMRRLELLEMEVGRDTLEVMGERSRAQSLAQQVANMKQQLAAQRCVATFLGSNEKCLREEIVNLQKVRLSLNCYACL